MLRRGLTIVLLAACSFAGCKAKTPEKLNDAMTLTVSYSQRGRFDNAIRVAQDWMEKHPEDFLYDQVAICYLAKASKDSGHKEQWIQQAAINLEKDLATHKKGVVDIELYEVGRGFERAGDLSTNEFGSKSPSNGSVFEQCPLSSHYFSGAGPPTLWLSAKMISLYFNSQLGGHFHGRPDTLK